MSPLRTKKSTELLSQTSGLSLIAGGLGSELERKNIWWDDTCLLFSWDLLLGPESTRQ